MGFCSIILNKERTGVLVYKCSGPIIGGDVDDAMPLNDAEDVFLVSLGYFGYAAVKFD